MTYEEFKTEYTKAFKAMMSYSPKEIGSQVYAEKLADLYDSNPVWADDVENNINY
jgi:hypothetical protein